MALAQAHEADDDENSSDEVRDRLADLVGGGAQFERDVGSGDVEHAGQSDDQDAE